MADFKARRQAARWNDLGRRSLSAALLAPVTLVCIWHGGLAYMVLIACAAAGLAVEWVWLCGEWPGRAPGLFVPTAVLAGLLVSVGGALLGMAVLMAGFGAVLAWGRRATLAAGVLYVGLPMLALLWLRLGAESGRANTLFLVSVVWASDIGAYAAGRLLGGPRLAPTLSPGKTWSGSGGGLVAAIAAGQAAAGLLGGAPSGQTALLAAVLGLATQAGDLLESAIKRHFGVKDSGRLIPGHGGLLDRLDGLLAAAPVATAAVLIGRGGLFWQ